MRRGERLDGRYALDRLIGDGGMGQVWSAWDERMQREVAVKVVTGLYGADEAELFARFRREIRLAADLPGRHTVIAHDCGEATVDGARQPYLVMELLTGRTLLETVRERRPSPAEAVAWAGQMATALTAAHARRIVHRDIKPHNVMFSADGELKVLDFGIAKFLGDTVLGGSITRTGKQVGTPLYMSPEQARGERTIDHRADLYSLGCVLYFMLTGESPFEADNVVTFHYRQAQPVVPPSELAEGIPAALEELVLALLEHEPGRRPESAAEVGFRLRALERQLPGPVDAYVSERRAEADRIVAQAQEYVRSQRDAADALFEETRSKAAQAAADFETNIHKRRVQAERHLAERQALAEKRLTEIEHRAEQLRLEAQKLRVDAEGRARQTVGAAQQQAADIVADANAKADQEYEESQQELAELSGRRGSIQAQLAHVRDALGAVLGTPLTPAGERQAARTVSQLIGIHEMLTVLTAGNDDVRSQGSFQQ
ncbi:protein kinase domain-containing protein [Streptomyces sp. NBC_01304]|uniref:serine/threonine-protein kinase n=1 Tax=Streptomyces sp. NBC_01304 TaxID=2903818 RepID=UPI003FA35057